MSSDDTYVIVPVYNEAEVVADVLHTVKKEFKNIVCVDDGSKDKSAEIIEQLGIVLVKHPINLGAGAATQTGIDYALQDPKAKYFVTIDADGQHDVKDAVRMLQYLKTNNFDVVFGSRFIGTVENIGRIKKLFLKAAAVFSQRTSGIKLTDPHNGLRAFNRKFAENIKLTLPDFTHASEIVHRIAEGGYKYGEVPATVRYSEYSKSKGQPMLNAINITIDLFFHRIANKK